MVNWLGGGLIKVVVLLILQFNIGLRWTEDQLVRIDSRQVTLRLLEGYLVFLLLHSKVVVPLHTCVLASIVLGRHRQTITTRHYSLIRSNLDQFTTRQVRGLIKATTNSTC